MSQEQLKQFSNLLSELNSHLVKINNIVFEMNNIINKLDTKPNSSLENDFTEQMNDLLKRINNMNHSTKLKVSYEDTNKLNNEQSNNLENIKNIIFKTTLGSKTTIEINISKTIDELLKQYLFKINRSDLINNTEESLYFTYNAEKLEIGDSRNISDVFLSNPNPTVLVSEF